jgi:glycosyltransferase involved in cell wall biosynthesis
MHDGAYQRLNQWPDLLQYIMARNGSYQVWIRCENIEASRESFAKLAEDYADRVVFLQAKKIPKLGGYISGLQGLLARARPRAIIVSGYSEPYYLQALLYAKLKAIPVAFVWESHALSSKYRTGVIAFLRQQITRLYTRFITPGMRASNYLQSMGVAPSRISQGVNATDMAALKTHIDAVKKTMQNAIDQQSAPADDAAEKPPIRFLYLGRYLALKGVMELLQAFADIDPKKATLTCVGYGAMEQPMRDYVQVHQMQNVTFLPAFDNMQQGVAHYLNADILVMPSFMRYGRSDVWGFVVNEALACGCYVIAGETIGALPELITSAPIDVGMPVNPENHHQFVATLRAAMEKFPSMNRDQIAAFGQSIGPEKMGDAFLETLQKL